MRQRLYRSGLMMLMTALMLGLLAACGGSSAGAGPEERVQSFFTDVNSAFNDANLKDAAKQEEWADKLSKYFIPEQQAKQKESLKESFSQMGSLIKPGDVKIENVKVEKVSEEGDTAQVKIVSGKMSMTMLGQTQELDLADAGLTGNNQNATLKKIDGTWYIDDTTAN